MQRSATVVLLVIAVCGCKKQDQRVGDPLPAELGEFGTIDLTGWIMEKETINRPTFDEEDGTVRLRKSYDGAFGISARQRMPEGSTRVSARLNLTGSPSNGEMTEVDQCVKSSLRASGIDDDYKMNIIEHHDLDGATTAIAEASFSIAMIELETRSLFALKGDRCLEVTVRTPAGHLKYKKDLLNQLFASYQP